MNKKIMSDPIYLAQNYALNGEAGISRPSDNVLVVGGTGTGKTLSFLVPNMLYMENASAIGTFPKSDMTEAYKKSLEARGYHVYIMNLAEPQKSNVYCDFLQYMKNTSDIETFNRAVIYAYSTQGNSKIDPYWNMKALSLLNGLTYYVKYYKGNSTYADVLETYERMSISESGSQISISADSGLVRLIKNDPDNYAARCLKSFARLPIKTASCIMDALDAPLRDMFPVSMREMMKKSEKIDFEKFAGEKSFLMIITSPVNTATYSFSNLFFSQVIKELFELAQRMPEGRLPRPVRLLFDDFACGCPIKDYEKNISIFRSAGISAMMLLQSESQLEGMYGEAGATTIINNCCTYLYFGGMDLKTCRNISERINAPLEDVLYMPLGKVIIMQTGTKPLIADRCETLKDARYKAMINRVHDRGLERIA